MSAIGHRSPGQVLVMFVLFLLVLLGISALAIDYASWLLVDRNLQNVADHASLAGASEFDDRTTQGSCLSGLGVVQCVDARAQAWTSVSDELGLGLSPAAIAALSLSNSPTAGITTITAGPDTFTWQDRVWVSTPPPNDDEYLAFDGRYALNYGIVFVRVDRDVRSFLGGAIGIQPGPRAGWATAGALPMDFALETFCRNHISPQRGVCENSAGITVDGSGVYVKVKRGDIASNESLKVTANNGLGVIVESGNFYLVNGRCASNTWNCPNGPPSLGGISDGTNGKNAFYMPPLPVPRFASPLGNTSTPLADTTETDDDCVGANATRLCVPFQPSGNNPGDWMCDNGSVNNKCGDPTFGVDANGNGTVTCTGVDAGLPSLHYYPISVSAGAANIQGDAAHPPITQEWNNINDDFIAGDLDTATTPANPPVDFLFTPDIDIGGGPGVKTVTTSFTVNLGPAGNRVAGSSIVRYVAYKTLGGLPDTTASPPAFPVVLDVNLIQGSTTIATDPTPRTLGSVPTRYEFSVGNGVITDFNSLRLQFTFSETGQRNTTNERGGAVSWAEIEHPDPQPATPPMIPPGYYHSIEIDSDGCAVLDPTAVYSDLEPYQMPGIYRFQGDNSAKIEIGDGGALIGDGVTLVFDYGFPDPAGNRGLVIHDDAVLALNSAMVPGVPVCTPTEPTQTITYNPSGPLTDLPMSSVCAAWGVDPTVTTAFRPGASAWAYCDPANASLPQCVDRSSYSPVATYRGVTFYFTPNAWPATQITGRFQMGGGAGATPGMVFQGVMYAPYDDVKMSGGCNGFNQVGQVLAWTTKFNGGCGYIELDYPYPSIPASPYLLEPTIDH